MEYHQPVSKRTLPLSKECRCMFISVSLSHWGFFGEFNG